MSAPGEKHAAHAGETEPGVEAKRSLVEGPSEWLERRLHERFEVTWSVDCVTEETFLYATLGNISELGIFVRTEEPLPAGTQLTLRFAPTKSCEPFVLRGCVQWINKVRRNHDNPNPGMGIRFIDLSACDRERIVDTIRTIAYLRDMPNIEE